MPIRYYLASAEDLSLIDRLSFSVSLSARGTGTKLHYARWLGLNITRLVCFHAETQCQEVNGWSYCTRYTTVSSPFPMTQRKLYEAF